MTRIDWAKNERNKRTEKRVDNTTNRLAGDYLKYKKLFKKEKDKLNRHLDSFRGTLNNYRHWKEFRDAKERRDIAYSLIK